MTQATRSLVSMAIMLASYSMPARAQDQPFHGWALLGGGTGSATIHCGGGACTSGDGLRGATYMLSVGYLYKPHWGVGVGLDLWWRDPADTEETNTASLFFRFYPSVHAGAFVEGGGGLSRASIELGGGTFAVGRGPSLMGAVGYDIRLLTAHGADITLTPRISYGYSSIGDLRNEDTRSLLATGWRHQVVTFGIALGFVGSRKPL